MTVKMTKAELLTHLRANELERERSKHSQAMGELGEELAALQETCDHSKTYYRVCLVCGYSKD